MFLSCTAVNECWREESTRFIRVMDPENMQFTQRPIDMYCNQQMHDEYAFETDPPPGNLISVRTKHVYETFLPTTQPSHCVHPVIHTASSEQKHMQHCAGPRLGFHTACSCMLGPT